MTIGKTPHYPPLILIVDDDDLVRQILFEKVQQDGYQVRTARNGEEAIVIYQEIQPDLVLMDGVMPEMDGFECCQHLQHLPGGDLTPVLMITGLDDSASLDRAYAVGAADYITKPIHWAVLRQRVKRVFWISSHLLSPIRSFQSRVAPKIRGTSAAKSSSSNSPKKSLSRLIKPKVLF